MFQDLYDAISLWFSSTWPEAVGSVTAVDVERVHAGDHESLRLAVAFEFSIGGDGPYTGESFWTPNFCVKRRVIAARRTIRTHQQVIVRYRPDDPSVNTLDRRTWSAL